MSDWGRCVSQLARDRIEGWPDGLKVRFYEAVDTICENPEAGRHYEDDDVWSYEDKSAKPFVRFTYMLDRQRRRVTILVADVPPASQEVHVFLSYTRKDREWLEALRRELRDLEKLDIHVWCDDDIDPGEDWLSLIGKKVSDLSAALLLVSRDFLKSQFIRDKELAAFLARAEDHSGEPFLLLWVPMVQRKVLEADSLGSRLIRYQALLDPRKPLHRHEQGKSMASKLSKLSMEVNRAIYRGLRRLPV
jgi:TIR domain